MIPLSVPEIEGGSPERHGGEEGLVLEYSSSWMCAETQRHSGAKGLLYTCGCQCPPSTRNQFAFSVVVLGAGVVLDV